jgi:MFS family permease
MENAQGCSRRNEAALLWQGIIFFVGLSFIDGNAVVPVFVNSMGGSLALAGLLSAVRVVPSVTAQMFIGLRASGVNNLPRFVSILMAAAYSMPLLMAAFLLPDIGAAFQLAAFLVLYMLLWAGDGSCMIGWYDLFGRLVAPRRRGLILGWQQMFGSMGALLCSMAVRSILSSEALPLRYRYAILFACASLLMAGSAAVMARVRDAPHRAVRRENPLKHIREFPALFRSHAGFRRMTAVQALQGVAAMALPILILFSKQTFALSLSATAWLIPLQTAGLLSGGMLWGAVSHRLGNRFVIALNQCNILLTLLLASAAALLGAVWLAFPLAFLSGISFSCWMGYMNHIADIVPEGKRPQYFVMSNLVNIPITFLPGLAGLLAGAVGFVPVFGICIAAACGSAVLAFALTPNPSPIA